MNEEMHQQLRAIYTANKTASDHYERLSSAMWRYRQLCGLFAPEDEPNIAIKPPISEVIGYITACCEAKRTAFAVLSKKQQDLISPFVTKYISTEWEEELITSITSSHKPQSLNGNNNHA